MLYLKKIKITTVAIVLIFLSSSVFSNQIRKNDLEKNLALMEFYKKYKKTEVPKWLKNKIKNEHGIASIEEDGTKIPVLKFENLLLRGTGVREKSYQESINKELYIMTIEGAQRYIGSHLDIFRAIETMSYGVIVSNMGRRHEFIVEKTEAIERASENAFEKGKYFYYQLSQLPEAITNDTYLLHIVMYQQEIEKMSVQLIKLVGPTDIKRYSELKREEGNIDIIHYRISIYSNLVQLSELVIREMLDEETPQAYDKEMLRSLYKKINTQMNILLSDKNFEGLTPEEKEIAKYVYTTQKREVKKFFLNIGIDLEKEGEEKEE